MKIKRLLRNGAQQQKILEEVDKSKERFFEDLNKEKDELKTKIVKNLKTKIKKR